MAVVREGLPLFCYVCYFVIKMFKCSPVPASFFPYLLSSLQSHLILTFNGFTRCQADLPQPEVISIYGYSYILTAPKMQKYLRICVHNLPMLAMPSSGLIHRDSMHVCNINVFILRGHWMLESDWLRNVLRCAIIFREMHGERSSRQLSWPHYSSVSLRQIISVIAKVLKPAETFQKAKS